MTNARQALPATAGQPRNIYNQYGFTTSGPVILPKVYDGRNRTFFLFSAEWIPWVRNNAQLATVPTAKMHNGDFSELSAPIYDPQSSTNPATRTAFPGNIIPASRVNPLGKLIIDKFPIPARSGLGSNIQGPMKVFTPVHNFSGRMDHIISERQRITFKETWVDSDSIQGWPLGENDISNSTIRFPSRNSTANYVLTIQPNLLYTAAFGFTQFHRVLTDPSGNTIGSGFFGYKVNPEPTAANSKVRPAANFDIYRGLGTGSSQGQLSRSMQWNQSLTWVRGRQTLRFGADLRRYLAGGLLTSGPAFGTFNFSPLQTSSGTALTGNSAASALLGLADSFTISQPPELTAHKNVYAVFVQDDIKIGPALTVNLGLRWDGEGALSAGNKVGYFDSQAINSSVNLPGVFRYAGLDGAPSTIVKGRFNTWSPRVGFAYALGAARKTAVRGAFGMYNAPVPTTGYYAAAPGYEPLAQFTKPSATEPGVVLRSNYDVPAASGPVGSAAYLGQSFTQPADRNLLVPRSYQWNFGFERELMKNAVLEVLYTGNRGVHLLSSYNLDLTPFSLVQQAIDAARSSGNPAAASAYLNVAVPNPLAGKVPGTAGGATVTRAQAALRYPQFLGVSSWVNNRDAIYHALQVTAQKRVGAGLTYLVSYTFSKDIDNVAADASGTIGDNVGSIQNPYNLRSERAPGSFDRRHNLSASVVYALPFGKGRRFFQQGLANNILGGFQFTGILSTYSGVPLALAQSASNGLGGGSRPDILPGAEAASEAIRGQIAASGNVYWIDPKAFAAAIGHYGNAPSRSDTFRGPSFTQFDLGIHRDFKLREGINLTFRAEAFNALNHTNLSLPTQNFSAPDFGQISASFDPRVVQFGLELRF